MAVAFARITAQSSIYLLYTFELFIFKNIKQLKKAALGSIIIAAVISLFKQLRDLPHYWRLDKLDFVIISCFQKARNGAGLGVGLD